MPASSWKARSPCRREPASARRTARASSPSQRNAPALPHRAGPQALGPRKLADECRDERVLVGAGDKDSFDAVPDEIEDTACGGRDDGPSGVRIASITTLPRPSGQEGRTSRVAASRAAATSFGASSGRCSTCSGRSRSRASTTCCRLPLPTITSRASGICAATRRHAVEDTVNVLVRLKRPHEECHWPPWEGRDGSCSEGRKVAVGWERCGSPLAAHLLHETRRKLRERSRCVSVAQRRLGDRIRRQREQPVGRPEP